MELMEETLTEWKMKNDPPLTTLYQVFNEILQGVEFLHQADHPIIHCDLKPDNILINHTRCSSKNCSPLHYNNLQLNRPGYDLPLTVKIADFGLINVLGSDWDLHPHEGTSTYKAPELKDSSNPTPASDIYSLGIIFYEMIHTFHTTMERVQNINEFKKGKILTNTILDRMIDPDPKKRPAVAEVRTYLESLYCQNILSNA
jgi:serine/threonine protein kinase